MKVIKNYLYNMSYQVLLIIIPLITLPYISRVLGPHGYGVYSFTTSIMSYFILLANLGIDVYGSRQIAYVQNDDRKRSIFFWEISLLKLLTTAISILLLGFYFSLNQAYFTLILAQSISLIAVAIDFSWYFNGIEDFKKIAVRNTLIQLISLICIFAFVKNSNDVLIYILIVTGSGFVGNVLLIPFLKEQVHRIPIKSLKVIYHIKPVIFLFIPQIGKQVYLVANRTILGIVGSITAVGYFSSADSIVRLILTVASAISAVLLPRISNLIAEKKFDSVEHFMKESFELINFLSFPLIIGLSVIAHKFIPIFLGNHYSIVANLIIVEAPAVLFISWSSAITNQYLIPAKMTKAFTVSTILGAVSSILLNVALIKVIGVYGAGLATLISELIVTIYLFNSIKGHFHSRSIFIFEIHKFIISSLVMGVFVYIIDKLFPNNLLYIGIEVLLGFLCYISCLWILRTNIIVNGKNFFEN